MKNFQIDLSNTKEKLNKSNEQIKIKQTEIDKYQKKIKDL